MPINLSPVVSIDGMELDANWAAALIEVRVELEFQVPARCTLRFADPGYALLETSLPDQRNLLALGKSVEVLGGGTSLITAEITSVAVEQRREEQPMLVVVAHDRSHRLGRGTRIKSYLSTRYSDLVESLAVAAALQADVDSTPLSFDYLMQVDSDLSLLTEAARRCGYDWWVDGTTLKFKAPHSTTTVNLSVGEELHSFSVRASGHHPGSFTVDGWDRVHQAQVESTTTFDNPVPDSDIARLVTGADGAFGTATLVTAGLGAQTADEAHQLSTAMSTRAEACAVSAHGVTPGNAEIRLGSSVQVTDAGPLSGTYPVTKVEHVYRSSGFFTRFVSGDRRPTSLLETLSAGGRRAGLVGPHLGVNVGQVTNINDPKNTGMVKVRFPGVNPNEESGWARLVAVGGGAERGNVFIPEVGDEVLVAFEGGDLRQPVVIGGLYGSKSTIPATRIEDGSVQVRGMTSRLGHVVLLLDGTDESDQAILLQLAGGENLIHLGKDKLDVEVPSGTPVNIVAGDTSIKFDAGGAIALAGSKISIEATQELTLSGLKVSISADTQLELEGQAGSTLKGATVQVSGDTAVQIKGTPVAIN
jgi:phage protein D